MRFFSAKSNTVVPPPVAHVTAAPTCQPGVTDLRSPPHQVFQLDTSVITLQTSSSERSIMISAIMAFLTRTGPPSPRARCPELKLLHFLTISGSPPVLLTRQNEAFRR